MQLPEALILSNVRIADDPLGGAHASPADNAFSGNLTHPGRLLGSISLEYHLLIFPMDCRAQSASFPCRDSPPVVSRAWVCELRCFIARRSTSPNQFRRNMKQSLCLPILYLMVGSHLANAQNANFLNPVQTGPFQYNGVSLVELAVAGPQSGFTDPLNLGSGYPVVTIDEMIADIQATGANLVKFTFSSGQVKTYTDNAYDPSIPFPMEGTAADIVAFGQKLTAQGIGCYVEPFAGVENIIAGAGNTSTVQPTDPAAFLGQHIPRLVSLAQIAESMGCEYFGLFGDEIEQLAVLPELTDMWLQAITQIRAVFSGRVIPSVSWGEHGGGYTFDHQPEIIAMLDVFGLEFGPAYTDQDDPTVAELVASYTDNSQGHNSLLAVADIHTLYQKAMFMTDQAWGSFRGSNVLSDDVLFGQYPASQFTVDYQEQVNLYSAFYQVMPTLDPQWMLGATFDSVDRLPYAWKDMYLPPYLGTVGESLMGKPALQTMTQTYHTTSPMRAPANGWWYNPATPGTYYVLDAENAVVHLGILSYGTTGDPQWSLVRCVQRPTGEYVGTAEQYTGGWALDQPATSPSGIVDGAAVQLVFDTPTTASLQIGDASISIRRYQFSDQWNSPMLNAPHAGWWDQPTQSGRGFFLEAQGNTLFVGGLIYDSAGQPSWFTSTGLVSSTGSFSGNLTLCSVRANSSGTAQASTCTASAKTINVTFKSPWDATLTLDQEAPVEIRHYRIAEIGWAGPAPTFPLANPSFLGQSATANAASYVTGVAPGSIATIFGTGLTRGVSGVVQPPGGEPSYSVHGTSVIVNGIPAPVFAVANVNGQEQINFQVPWEVQGQPIPRVPLSPIIITTAPAASIVVVNNGQTSPAMRAYFFDSQPAIITSNGTQAVAVHSGGSLVTSANPAQPGEVITLYGVGCGPVTPSVATGAPSGASPPSVISPTPTVGIAGQNAKVQFAGLSPGSVGLYQLNVIVPDGLAAGDLPTAIRIGGQISNVFFIPVQGAAGAQSGELIRNGGFENPFMGDWFLYVNSNSTAAATLDRSTSVVHEGNYSAHISVTTAGTSLGDVVFFEGGLPLVQGTTYLLQFWATSSAAEMLGLQIGGGGPQNYGLATSVTLGSDWQLYQFTFQATQSTTNGMLSYYLGPQTGDTWFDDVSLMALIPPTGP